MALTLLITDSLSLNAFFQTQNLFRDLAIIGYLLQLLQRICIKSHFDDPVTYGREIAICKKTVHLLTEACRDNAGNGTMMYWASNQLVQYEVLSLALVHWLC